MKFLGYGSQTVEDDDVEVVSELLRGGALTCGPKVDEFEEAFAEYTGSKYAVSLSNGTAALHLAGLAAGLKEGDLHITSPLTFAASSNMALYCGAKTIFCDINEEGLLDPQKLPELLCPEVKTITPVHYAGQVCDMKKIRELAPDKIIIEDACHALSARGKDHQIGDCKYSDMACFSFHPVKPITTCEGGMITTNDESLYKKLKLLRSHGIQKDIEYNRSKGNPDWYQQMFDLGYNYRLSDLQCALGLNQLKKQDRFVKRRREIARRYNEAFANHPRMKILNATKDPNSHGFHLYVLQFLEEGLRNRIYEELLQMQIGTQVHYVPVPMHPYYQELGYSMDSCPKTEQIFDGILSFPIYPKLTEEDQERVIKSLLKLLEN